MKNFKRTVAAVMTSALLLTPCVASMSMNAFADDGDYTITINNGEAASTHSFEAYQIFTGSINGTGDEAVLSNIQWGGGVSGSALLTAIKNSSEIGADFSEATDAAGVAKVLEENTAYTKDSAKMVEFAKIVSKHLTTAAIDTAGAGNVIALNGAGYYFIKDVTASLGENSADSLSRPIIKVVDDVTVSEKKPAPTLDKVITSSNQTEDGKQNSVKYGDTVNFKITSNVPDRTGYDKYYFIVRDTYDENFVLNNDFAVKIGDTTLVENTEYYIDSDTANHKFRVIFKDFVNRTEATGTAIEVTYSATVKTNATFKSDGYDNTADLMYSNNPYVDYKGWYNDNPTDPSNPTPDDPTDDTPKTPDPTDPNSPPTNPPTNPPTGDTPDKKTTSFPVKLNILKLDKSDSDKPMAGVTFTLTGPDQGSGKTYTTDSNGRFTIEGLAIGDYTLTESPLEGYNTLAPINFTITNGLEATPKSSTIKLSVTSPFVADDVDNTFQTTIYNNKGSQLPSTGGIGTTLFYVIGGMLVVGSSVVLVTKKRMSAEKK